MNQNIMNKSILSLATIVTSCFISTTLKGEPDNLSKTTKPLEQISAPEENNTFSLKDIISSNFLQQNQKSTLSKEQKTKSTKKDLFAEDLTPFNEVDPWD